MTVVDGQVVEIVQTAGEPIPITAATTTTTTTSTTQLDDELDDDDHAAADHDAATTRCPDAARQRQDGGGSGGEGGASTSPDRSRRAGIITEDEVGEFEPGGLHGAARQPGDRRRRCSVKFTELPTGEFGVIQWCDPEAIGQGEAAGAAVECCEANGCRWSPRPCTPTVSSSGSCRCSTSPATSSARALSESTFPSFDDCFGEGNGYGNPEVPRRSSS